MIVEIQNSKYYVSWIHKVTGSKKGTTVVIKDKPGKDVEPLATAKSHLHKQDVYDKNIGRIRSLTKLLATLYPGQLNRPQRMRFWNQYAQMRNGSVA